MIGYGDVPEMESGADPVKQQLVQETQAAPEQKVFGELAITTASVCFGSQFWDGMATAGLMTDGMQVWVNDVDTEVQAFEDVSVHTTEKLTVYPPATLRSALIWNGQ